MRNTRQINHTLTREEIHLMAVDIDQFAEEYDTYGYRDDVDDTEENIQKLENCIIKGDTAHYERHLQEIIDEDDLPENTQTARQLLRRLKQAVTPAGGPK